MEQFIDPIRLWNSCLSALAEGIVLSGRGLLLLSPTPPSPPDTAATTAPVVRLETDAGPAYAEFGHLPLGAITQSTLDTASLSRLPLPLAEAILRHAVDQLLHQVALPARARIHAITPCTRDQIAGQESLPLSIQGIWPDPVHLALHADRAVLGPLLIDMLPAAPTGHLSESVARHLHLPCSLRLADRTLPLSRLRSLGPGDILLLTAAQRTLVAPHATFDLTHDGSNWTIGNRAMNDDIPPADLAAIPSPDRPASDIGELPIRLSFVLADVSLTVSDLQTLGKGSYLPFDPGPSGPGQPVRILANGRQIGDGHVVQVDGQPAVRIARLFDA